METTTAGWVGLFSVLFISTFGLFWLLTGIIGTLIFIIGIFSLLYIKQGNLDRFYNITLGNPLTNNVQTEGGLKYVSKQVTSPKKAHKSDTRVTGSELIDSSLQEILGYIIRDYILPWYNLISIDREFTDESVKHTAQMFAINIANRVKDTDWIPYLTQRLVDEAASHLRLYKQARTRMKLQDKQKDSRNSPSKDQKNSPKHTLQHKRNKSETDVSWYVGRNTEFKKDLERNIGNSKFYVNMNRKNCTLEDHFFELECQMENNLICRDGICMDPINEKGYIFLYKYTYSTFLKVAALKMSKLLEEPRLNIQKEFLSEITEVLLYILLPNDDFQCKPLRFILRDIFANGIFLPLLNLISDPDYINQVIIWLCLREPQLPSDIFLTTLRLTDSPDELKSTKELILSEIHNLRSRDAGGESDLSIKQQLSSLYYVLKLIDNRLSKMENFEDGESHGSPDSMENIANIDLTLVYILKNNVALSYFIDFVSSQNKQFDLFFYLNIEGWKVSVEQQLSELHLKKLKGSPENPAAIYEMIRSTALSIYDQYLGKKSENKVLINLELVENLHFKIINLNETPNEMWFDKVQEVLYIRMDQECLPYFKKSKAYVKLLHELDLVPQNANEEDDLSLNSIENMGNESSKQIPPIQATYKVDYLTVQNTGSESPKSVKHTRSFSDVTTLSRISDETDSSRHHSLNASQESNQNGGEVLNALSVERAKISEQNLKTGEYVLAVNIIETGIVCEKGKTFGIYALRVSRQYETGFLEEWHIYRRYSDFHDLYTKVKEKFPDLSKLSFPGKKTFHNMDRAVLERRMKMLGSYMHELCQPIVISRHPYLKEMIMSFLEQGEYDRATYGPISSTINTLVNPLKSSMKTIKNMPEQLINTVDEVVVGLSKVFHTKSGKLPEASKVGASIEESDDNIPLRIMLLLMDEVFDLKSRNQWLRRRIVTLLRQIVRTMFGDIVNRRILDYVSLVTSPKNVAHYLYVFKQSFWPNGVKSEKQLERDLQTRSRTRVAAKVALLSCLSDELKHIIGSETTRRGLLMIFELFQRPILNRRLLHVLLEGVLCTLFPEKNMLKLFQKLHSKSKVIDKKNTQCR